jgi:hypothetical protein
MALLSLCLVLAWFDGKSSTLHVPNVKTTNEQSAEKPEQRPLTSSTEHLIFGWPAIDVFTAILAAATLILAYMAIKQFRDARIVQRAYLGTIPRKLHEMADTTTIAHIAFVNTGNLPARNVRNNVKIGWFEDGNKKDFERVEVEEGTVLILPGTKIERGTPSLSSGDEIKYRARIGYVYVWGRVEYQDGFRDGRWLIFCHRYNCSKAEIPRLHHHHNDGN